MEDLKTDYISSMKVSKETFEQIKSDYQKLFNTLDEDDLKVFKTLVEDNKTSAIWQFWDKICRDKQTHQNVNSKNRVFETDPEFEMYPDDTNDQTLETALTRAFNNLLLINIEDVPELIDRYVIFNGESKIDDERMIRWWEPNEEKYESIEDEIRDFTIEGNGWELHTWHDISGWDYWINQQGECNYIQITVEFKEDQAHRFELPKIEDAMDKARGHFDKYNNPGAEGSFPS